jgi:NAD(P)-dependent dehydrogenase (short-subunit alcohol dehydrogenase family)
MTQDIRTAVVTGAGSGIGRALVTQLTSEGVSVVAVDVDRASVEALDDELGVRTVCLDVADRPGTEALAEQVGPPDLVCLNAGVASATALPVWSTPDDDWNRVLAVNLGGVRNGLAAFVPRMLATGRRHRLLITASLAGVATWPGGGAYAASKHAAVAVAEQAALSLAGTPVSVTLLCPALVRSRMSPSGEDPAAVAEAALSACREGRFAVIPEEWHGAVRERAARLAAGAPPVLPRPREAAEAELPGRVGGSSAWRQEAVRVARGRPGARTATATSTDAGRTAASAHRLE